MQLKQIIDGIDGLTLRMADGSSVDSAVATFTGLSADSRNLRAGFIFAALPGTMVAKGAAKARDGRDFIDQAVAAGAGFASSSCPIFTRATVKEITNKSSIDQRPIHSII